VLEKEIESKCKKYAKSKGVLAYKWVSPNNRGVTDCIFIYQGKVFFVEFKRQGGRLTKLQIKHHDELRAQGMTVYVVWSLEEGKEMVEDILNA